MEKNAPLAKSVAAAFTPTKVVKKIPAPARVTVSIAGAHAKPILLAAADQSGSPIINTRQKTIEVRAPRHAVRPLPLRLRLTQNQYPRRHYDKSDSVRMLDRSAKVSISQMPAGMATANPASLVLT